MLSNAYFLANFRFDTAENEPAKKLQKNCKCGRRLHRRRPLIHHFDFDWPSDFDASHGATLQDYGAHVYDRQERKGPLESGKLYRARSRLHRNEILQEIKICVGKLSPRSTQCNNALLCTALQSQFFVKILHYRLILLLTFHCDITFSHFILHFSHFIRPKKFGFNTAENEHLRVYRNDVRVVRVNFTGSTRKRIYA